MRYKNIVKFIVFFIGLFTLLIVLSIFFLPKDNYEVGPAKKLRGIYKVQKNTLDYIAIGDSECNSSISPMEIWKKYGYTGYNCGVPGQRMQDTYYMLKKLLKRQTPKVILLETNEFYRSFKFFEELQTNVDGVTKQVLPIYKYHSRWKSFAADAMENRHLKSRFTRFYIFKGYRYNITTDPYTNGSYVKKTDQTAKIPKIPSFYLNKIVTLCREKNIKLILFSAPTPLCWSYQKHNSNLAFAKKNKLPYIDLNLHNNKVGIDWAHNTRDKGDHMNFYGAKKVTRYMGSYLSRNCNLKDHRMDQRYAEWNKTLKKYLKLTKQNG